jgi:methionine--tRNA ligase beta chain
MIPIEDFKKVEMKIGVILSAEKVADADKLLKLSVDFGEENPRQIISGISAYFPDPQVLVGKKCPFVANLEYRTIRGLESQGMIMAVGTPEGFFSLLEASPDTPPGSAIK